MTSTIHAMNAGLIDPMRQAEYPILLGEKLAGKGSSSSSHFIGIRYNHKPKSASLGQNPVITSASGFADTYKLTIENKTSESQQNPLRYRYHGSVDPKSSASETEPGALILVFDPERKAFILETVATELNFNLTSSPGKTKKEVAEQYPQLDVHTDGEPPSLDVSEAEQSAPDDDNPYDFRHFLHGKYAPSTTTKQPLEASPSPIPQPSHVTSRPITSNSFTGNKPKPKPRPKAQPQPARSTTTTTRPRPKSKPKSAPRIIEDAGESSADERPVTKPNLSKAVSSPRIIIDGALTIDMGSPTPTRPKADPRNFASSSNNTSANEADDDNESDEDDDVDDLRLPSPAAHNTTTSAPTGGVVDEEDDDDDGLAAEMEAALEESAREEEEMQDKGQAQDDRGAASDESEVSEEE